MAAEVNKIIIYIKRGLNKDGYKMTKEIIINAPEGAKIEGLQIEQTISQPADLEVGPVKVGDASVLTWTNAGIVVVLIAAVVIGKKLISN